MKSNKYRVKYKIIGGEQQAIITIEIKVMATSICQALSTSKSMLSNKHEYQLLKVYS